MTYTYTLYCIVGLYKQAREYSLSNIQTYVSTITDCKEHLASVLDAINSPNTESVTRNENKNNQRTIV